jgi:hypothetical protein
MRTRGGNLQTKGNSMNPLSSGLCPVPDDVPGYRFEGLGFRGRSAESRPRALGLRPSVGPRFQGLGNRLRNAQQENPKEKDSGETRRAQERGRGRFAGAMIAAAILILFYHLIPTTYNVTLAQSELAGVYGRVTDPSGAVIVDAEVEIRNVETNVSTTVKTNRDGLYTIPSLHPGQYLVNVRKPGFKSVTVTQLTLNVQDNVVRNFALQLGSVSETVTITADQNNINTTDATVSTVVDRKFVENMPLNGRSFQDLLTLAPGATLVGSLGNGGSAGPGNAGEITVNGQRTEENYFSVDGVSANTGANFANGNTSGAGFSGSTPGVSLLGSTQSLVSIDALQEFRASTSTYSAEYGRTPGGQFAFTTRSGANDWHGSAFDYFRNEVMDANNWFNNAATPQVPRLPERQNDFGGTLGGPTVIPGLYNGRDKTFFFFSYEGLRLKVPQPVVQSAVPDMALRQAAPAAVQPFLNAFPMPNGGEDGLNDGLAFYNVAYSAPFSLNSTSIRIDHNFGEKTKLFGRFANTPSRSWSFGPEPANRFTQAINVRSLTVGLTNLLNSTQSNEVRFNITQNNQNYNLSLTNLGGAIPFSYSNLSGPNGQTATLSNVNENFYLLYGAGPSWLVGPSTAAQRQYNVVDTYSWSHGVHQFKFGLDWRRLTTLTSSPSTSQSPLFFSEASVLSNSVDLAVASAGLGEVEPVYHNFSAFVQDEWKVTRQLSLSLGLRWDINPAPGNLNGSPPYTLDQISNLATAKLAPVNTPLWRTDWNGFAPRVGIAYQLRQAAGHETVLRVGSGLFYDMGNTVGSQGFLGIGLGGFSEYFGVPLPLTSAQATPPPPNIAPPYTKQVYAFDPNLRLPYAVQWNMAVEQALGSHQTLTVGYVGSAGRKLLSQFRYAPENFGNPNFDASACPACLFVTRNAAGSDYNALQVKYQKALSYGLQVLGSYTFSHSIDDASGNFGVGGLLRASSDFDVRHNFQAAITYDIPGRYSNPAVSALLRNWGVDARISARSALPVDIHSSSTISNPLTLQLQGTQPDLVPGEPIYLYGSQYPGGRVINYNAFTVPASDVNGDTPRNFARGFDAVSLNLALRRDFPIQERLRLQFRAEAFNIFNQPNFGAVAGSLGDGPQLFGRAYNTLNNALGGLNALYQSGGPRSLQLMLKLQF